MASGEEWESGKLERGKGKNRKQPEREALRCEELARKDLPDLASFGNRFLTIGEQDLGRLCTEWDAGRLFGCVLRTASGRAAGFFSMSEGVSFTYPHPELEREIRDFAGGRRICTCSAIVLLPEYQGTGAGGVMFDRILLQARERGCELVLIENWIYPDGHIPAKRRSEQMGRVVFARKMPGFYRDFPRYGMRCPICGEHCICGAYILVLEIQNP